MNAFNQDLGAMDLCREGDKTFLAGDIGRAAALYTQSFGSHAGVTMAHMRSLDRSHLDQVIYTLEARLDGHGVAQNSMAGLSKGLAAVFLSTLCPNNISASLFKMESVLLGSGQGSNEIFARCSAILEGKKSPRPEGPTRLILELTRALACLLSEPPNPKAPRLYLQAFHGNRSETVRLVKSRQAEHLPRILKVFFDQMSHRFPILHAGCIFESNLRHEELSPLESVEFLLSVLPENTLVRELHAAVLFSQGKFEESAENLTLALQLAESQTDTVANLATWGTGPERKASLFISRAAAHFSTGGHAQEACLDLGEGFAVHPATARHQFQRVFSDSREGAVARVQLRQQAERGLSSFKEIVLARPDLRSSNGLELLDPVIAQLRALCHLEPDGGGRELRVRLAECLLLRGEFGEALSISSQLAAAAPPQQSYQNTVQVLRGFSRLLCEDHKGALEDFQAVIEHSTPHPPSCVRALCGRGLLRMMAHTHYLTALDYITSSRLQHQDTALTVRCLVPWNYRGLLCTVLLEQGRVMLEEVGEQSSSSDSTAVQDHQQSNQKPSMQTKESYNIKNEGMAVGVHALAVLLMDLQPGVDAPQVLAADALYQLDHAEEAYRLLLCMEHSSPRSVILVRLAMLQLHRGFQYDAHQLLKKLIHCGDTSCLRPLLSVAAPKDRALLEKHCHNASKRILESQQEESAIREAVAYLSIAIMSSGGEAVDSLLERARCYVRLGQRKTAVFDFSAIIKEHPDHVQALCGRGFTYVMLNQQKESTQDILAALKVDAEHVTQSILSLKDKARNLVCEWLRQHCHDSLSTILSTNPVPCRKECLREAFLIGGVLMKTDSKDPRWHLLYIDILLAGGETKAAGAHLRQVFGQEPRDAAALARWGVVESWQKNYRLAARRLSAVSEKEPSMLDFLLTLIQTTQRPHLAQAASLEASSVAESGQKERALALITVAVRAVGGTKLQLLRQRAACLVQLGLHERAISDLDQVIHSHSPDSNEEPAVWVKDLCQRGCSLLLCSRDELALQDFSQALDLDVEQTLLCVDTGPSRTHLSEVFLRVALQHYGEQQLERAWYLTERGLKLNSSHMELRRLRARIKREISSPCTVH
ncbi:uncharacterized protein ttc34 [Hoplias malabaricus]|uniref:uncharacterized protein ttc34 n=1 Tax=Hoplias malabaricus TaxID=27720 RepID=UPI00346337FA